MNRETTFFSEGGVTVTQSRLITPSQTFAMSGVTSVTSLVFQPSRGTPGCLGAIAVAACLAGQLGLGLLLLVAAGLWWVACKPTYIIRLTTASGQSDALSSKDAALIDQVTAAINEAIVARG